ncbi:MAG: hypothetical protein ACE5EQ_08235 [Phycisphaerae bacterium]
MSFDPHTLPVPDLGLLCKRCRYPLASLPEHRCPECGTQFDVDDYIPPGDTPVVIINGHEVRMNDSVIEVIRRARIPHLEELHPAETMPGLRQRSQRGGRLAVPRGYYFQVIDLLRRYELFAELPPPPADPPPEWTCPACNESNPGTFELCWNCSENHPTGR